MTFLWPEALWFLLALPALVAAYVFLLRRRRKRTLRISSLGIVREAMGRGDVRRHVPPVLLLLGIGALAVAIARPTTVLSLPGFEQTVILAIDVSASMQADDVEPNRLAAAQRAAKEFVRGIPRTVRVGIVSFAGTAAVAQGPTLDHQQLDDAIERLRLGPSTNMYSGIALSLAAMFPNAGIEAEPFTDRRNSGGARAERPPPLPAPTAAPGSYRSGAIVLLSDGQRTMGGDPIDAAQMAAGRGVKVYTVGLGTAEGSLITFRGATIRVRLDEDTLKEVARITRAQYFNATTADDLRAVYQGLTHRVVTEKQETELTALFALAAALLVVIAAGLSIVWYGFRSA
jgi:Ca-activated chloride channel family protein